MSDEHRWRRKCFVICLLALFIGLIGIVLPEIDVGVKQYINASDINQSGLTSFPCSLNNVSNIDALNCTGVEGSIPFYIDFNFTNVTNFTNIETKLYYNALTGFSAHEVHLEIFCTNENRFIVLERFTGENQWQYFSNDILSYTHFIRNDGNVTLRINHTENGITTHRVIIDVVRLVNDPNFEQNIINLTQTIGGGTGSQNLSQVLNQGNTTNGQTINFTNSGNWLNVGYNSASGLMEANTASVLYYKQAGTFIGFQGGGFAYSSYDNKHMKFGESGTNYSSIVHNATYGTTFQARGTANNNLNITGFDKVNFYQDLEMNENNLTGAYFINQSIINGSFGGFAFLGSATTQFYQAWENSSTIRTELTYGGSQAWKLRNTDAGGKAEAGYIVYSTPGGLPGITFYNASILFRNNFFAIDGGGKKGMMINSANGSSFKATGLLVGTDDNVTIDGLAGTGNAYVCVDANGKLYRGNPTC